MLGIPGGKTASSTGYVSGDNLTSLIRYAQNFSSFGGVMLWDMVEIQDDTEVFDKVIATLRPPVIPHHKPDSSEKDLSGKQGHKSSSSSMRVERDSRVLHLLAFGSLINNLFLL